MIIILIALPLIIANMAVNMVVNPNRETSHNPEKAYAQLFEELPPAKMWVEDLQSRGALRDTFIISNDGRRLHAIYAAAGCESRLRTEFFDGGHHCGLREQETILQFFRDF